MVIEHIGVISFYTKHKSLFISQVVKWLDAFVALQNSNGKSLFYMSDGYLYKRKKRYFISINNCVIKYHFTFLARIFVSTIIVSVYFYLIYTKRGNAWTGNLIFKTKLTTNKFLLINKLSLIFWSWF